jgi:Integrase core domain
MGSVGDPWDNAMAETFFASLEKELRRREHFETREHARVRIFWYIEYFYNPAAGTPAWAGSHPQTTNSDTTRRPMRPNHQVSTQAGQLHHVDPTGDTPPHPVPHAV